MKTLLTGAGCPGWLSVHSALSSSKAVVCSCDIEYYKYGYKYANKSWIVPRGSDPSYPDSIKTIVEDDKLQLIIPLTDPELIPLAGIKEDLIKLGCSVLVSDVETLEVATDKLKLYTTFPEISPRFQNGYEKVEEFIESTNGVSCFMKLHTAHGSRGTKRVVKKQRWLDSFRTTKPNEFGMLFPLEEISSLGLGNDEIVLVEELPGAEYSIDCVFDTKGQLVFYGAREREVIANGICSVAKFTVDEHNEFLHLIDDLTKKLKFQFNINIQVKRDKDRKLKLLEINPRISGSIGSFCSAGYNLPLMSYQLATENKYPTIFTPLQYPISRAYRTTSF